MKYPEYAEIGGELYKINTDYNTALRCFEVIDDPNISGEERSLAIIYLLFGFIPENNIEKFFRAAEKYLKCGEEQTGETSTKRDIDFNYDDSLIRASFMSDYHIDLSKEDMHFWQYVTLLKGLTETCVLSRVREIRNYDLSEIKDSKLRNKMANAKKEVALPVRRSQEEQAAVDEFESLFGGD